MKILSKEVVEDVNILTYFRLNKDFSKKSDFVLYTKEEKNTVYLANLYYDNEKIYFVLPSKDDLMILKQIVENMIKDNPNEMVFSQRQYKYMPIEDLEKHNIEEKTFQKISFSEDKFEKLSNSKYLKYPLTNLQHITNQQVEMINKDNVKKPLIISSIVLAAFVLLLVISHFISKEITLFKIYDFTDVRNFFMLFFYIPSPLFALKLLVISLILTLFTYNSDSSHPGIFFTICSLFIFIMAIIVAQTQHMIDLANIGEYKTIILLFFVLSLVNSLIITIVYSVFREVTLEIVKHLKVRNFLIEYTIFSIPFITTLLGVVLAYDFYGYKYVIQFLGKLL